jgi:hypothetical protein
VIAAGATEVRIGDKVTGEGSSISYRSIFKFAKLHVWCFNNAFGNSILRPKISYGNNVL